jgi:ribosomal protein S18 acetylase RimI-like enzyme
LALSVVRGSIEDLDALEPLWVGVHHVHAASMPELAPYVSDAETWAEHRPLYVELFEKPDTSLFLARLDEALVGYALIHVEPVRETWVADTWRTGERIGELESIAVAPEQRGRGIGSALLDAVDREFEVLGVADVIIGLLPGNEGARRLYESRGFRPTWMYLARFAGR